MNFSLTNIHTNEAWELKLEAKGRPVMITFWTSWCPDSKRDLAEKRPFYQHIDSEKLCFVTINVTGREGDVDRVAWLREYDHDFLVLADSGTKVYDAFDCSGVPTTVLLTKELEVAATYGENSRLSTIMAGLAKLID